jgi:hypothetical protein
VVQKQSLGKVNLVPDYENLFNSELTSDEANQEGNKDWEYFSHDGTLKMQGNWNGGDQRLSWLEAVG